MYVYVSYDLSYSIFLFPFYVYIFPLWIKEEEGIYRGRTRLKLGRNPVRNWMKSNSNSKIP